MKHQTLGFSNAVLWRSRRIYFIGALGTIIEWYDFALYGRLAHIFARQFFVNTSHWLSLLLVYLIFFISYLARPLGGLFYGLIGDYYGRKPALLLSVTMMAFCMFAMSALPSWKTAGAIAPILLVTFRIVQGFSVGGETSGSLIYVLESVAPKRQGFYGACIWSMAWIGVFFASLVTVLLMHLLPQTQLLAWGWRVAYLIGGAAGLIIFGLRMFMTESIEFEEAKQQVEQTVQPLSLKEILFEHKLTILIVFGVFAMPATIDVFINTYYAQYIYQYFSIPLVTAWSMTTGLLCLAIVGMIGFGILSDRIGRRRVMMTSAACLLLFSYPILHLLSIGRLPIAVGVLLFFVIASAMYDGPLPALLVKLAPLRVRYTVFALGYNISYAIFGGSSLLVCSLLARFSPLAPAFYFMMLALFSLLALYFLGNRAKSG